MQLLNNYAQHFLLYRDRLLVVQQGILQNAPGRIYMPGHAISVQRMLQQLL
jgi:hypothetical protein